MQTGRRKLSAFMAFFLVFAMLFSMVPSISSYADEPSAEDTTKPKIINVVFDDSRSMYMNQLTTWCQAKYALEVFTAMMGEKDTINIYPMSYFDESAGTDKITTVKGGKDSKAAVKEVHNMNSNYWGTPIESIDGAAEALAKENADKYDLWLVILTDGEKFYVDGKEQSTSETQRLLKEKLNTYAEQFNVAYLAIGDNPKNIEKTNPSNGLNSYTANGKNGEILTRVTEIANLIFQYQLLPNSLIKQSGSTYSLDVDIPTTQIIAFAQGENVSISNMKLDGDALNGSDVTVKFSDVLPIDGQTKKTAANVVTDESLKGVITRYNAQSSNKPFKAGTYTVDISGADAKNVQFYYKPGVKATCQLLFMDGNVVDPNEGIVEGDYKVSFAFVNPLNNQAVTSKYGLLEQVGTPENHIYNNDTELDISGEIVHLAEGTVTITTTVNLIGKLKLTAREKYNVKKESVNIEIRFGIPEGAYKAHQLGEAATPVIATIYDLKTGAPLTREQWEECKVTIEGEKDEKLITWDIKKGSDCKYSDR